MGRVMASEGCGYPRPPRESDCTGRRPSWYPFQINVGACDNDAPDPAPLTSRHERLPDPKPIPWSPE